MGQTSPDTYAYEYVQRKAVSYVMGNTALKTIFGYDIVTVLKKN